MSDSDKKNTYHPKFGAGIMERPCPVREPWVDEFLRTLPKDEFLRFVLTREPRPVRPVKRRVDLECKSHLGMAARYRAIIFVEPTVTRTTLPKACPHCHVVWDRKERSFLGDAEKAKPAGVSWAEANRRGARRHKTIAAREAQLERSLSHGDAETEQVDAE